MCADVRQLRYLAASTRLSLATPWQPEVGDQNACTNYVMIHARILNVTCNVQISPVPTSLCTGIGCSYHGLEVHVHIDLACAWVSRLVQSLLLFLAFFGPLHGIRTPLRLDSESSGIVAREYSTDERIVCCSMVCNTQECLDILDFGETESAYKE